MNKRRTLTAAERGALIDLGWNVDGEGWWWQPNSALRGEAGCHLGHTAAEAVRVARRIARRSLARLEGL